MERRWKHEEEGIGRAVRMRIDRLRQRGKMAADRDMYSILGLTSRDATDTEVRSESCISRALAYWTQDT